MVNHLVFQGRMVTEPELKHTKINNVPTTAFRLVWSEKRGEAENRCWLSCAAFRGTAESICKYVSKGREIAVEGKLITNEWEKDGQKHQATQLLVERFHFCGPKMDGGSDTVAKASGEAASAQKAQAAEKSNDWGSEDDDGELPF